MEHPFYYRSARGRPHSPPSQKPALEGTGSVRAQGAARSSSGLSAIIQAMPQTSGFAPDAGLAQLCLNACHDPKPQTPGCRQRAIGRGLRPGRGQSASVLLRLAFYSSAICPDFTIFHPKFTCLATCPPE